MRFSIFSVTDHYPDEPRTITDWYEQLLGEIVLADQLGYSTFFLAEHHFHEYGVVPSPPTMLGAASQRTERIALGIAVAQLPFHKPMVLAEEYAMVDRLSGGRLALGLGSGYLKHEFDGFGIGPWEKRFRFDEALDILTRAWSGEPVTYHGLYHHVDGVRIAVTPVQKPHPPMWIAILQPDAAYHVGRQGRDVMLIPYATAKDQGDLREVIARHREGFAEAEVDRAPEAAVALHAYVGEDAATVREEVDAALDRYVNSRLYARPRPYEELDAAGLVAFGDADSVSERVAELQEIGVDHLMLLANFGALPRQRVRESMERFAREVAPSFAEEMRPAGV